MHSKQKVEEGEGKEEEEQGQKRNINKKVVEQEGEEEEDKKNNKREKEESTSKRTGNEIMVLWMFKWQTADDRSKNKYQSKRQSSS